jgi:hypothetical protein
MKLNQVETKILVGVFKDLARIKASAKKKKRPAGFKFFEWKHIVEDSRRNIVRSDSPRWLEVALTPAHRKAISRAYERLHRLGLIRRDAGGPCANYVTHVHLTPIGAELAATLKKELKKRAHADG